jgi:hypothetical protein
VCKRGETPQRKHTGSKPRSQNLHRGGIAPARGLFGGIESNGSQNSDCVGFDWRSTIVLKGMRYSQRV